MSRLAHLLTQLATTSQTQEKLAATYFERPSTKPASPPAWRFILLLATVAALGVCLGLLIGHARRPLARSPVQPIHNIYPVLTFDDASAWESLGQRFGVWWSQPGDPHQSLTLAPDSETYAGSSGQSLRIDYTLAVPPENSPPVGVWFALPASLKTPSYQLEFLIRGDSRIGYTRQATLELRNDTFSEQQPLTIGPEWRTVRVPLALQLSPDGHVQRWHEFRILFQGDRVTVARGRIYIDQVRLTALTP